MVFLRILEKINPTRLFLIDSLGALLSALMLGLVLANLENVFGIPPGVLYFLAFIACIFFVYSFLCFKGNIENWRPYMKLIAIANLLYCCLTIGVIIYIPQKPTALGLLYFVLEIFAVTILATIELKVASTVVYKKA